MGMVSVPIGSLVTGLNPSAAMHLFGDMFLSRWVPDTKYHKETLESMPESPSEAAKDPLLGNVLLNIE
ncbi:hypothetical protein DSO57_1005036 [Entomophthora muscae]|uniref:Uncharacterized protein n=1 Tax=Entomophthora muscae TaxID=34485 RepID=A0ACC2UHF3_9FUNG|nr:hypothetical protein DSO57_1005036 [Entomophthora muscae]